MTLSVLNIDRENIDPDDTAEYFDSFANSPDTLMKFVRHCEIDSFLQMAIASKVQILALTKQLTNLAGNSWYTLFHLPTSILFSHTSQLQE